MYKVAVCDDEKSVCHQVEKILLTFAKERCLSLDVEIFYDGSALLEFIETEHNFDLIYMDIEMGNLNGVRTSQEIRHAMDDLHTEIVFISGTENYYRQLFDVQPLLFIGKPICADSITEALLLAMKRNRALTSCFYFKIGKETQRIAFFEILYFESCNRKTRIVTHNKEVFYYEKFNLLIDKLPDIFSRIHRCYIVNRQQIICYSSQEVTLVNNEKLPLSETYRDDFIAMQIMDMDESIRGDK